MRMQVVAVGLLVAMPAAARAADDPAALVRRGIAAAGGAEKLGAGKVLVGQSEGTTYQGGAASPFRIRYWREGGVRTRIDSTAAPAGESRLVAEGTVWRVEADGRLTRLDGQPVETALIGLYVAGVADLVPLTTDPWFTLVPLGPGNALGRPADGVLVTRPDRPEVLLWFDRETGLLAQYTARFPAGVQDMILDDYKDFAGAKRATRRVGFRSGEKIVEERTTEYQVSDAPDPALFALPRPDVANDPRTVIRDYAAAVGGAERLARLRCEYTKRTTRVFAAAVVAGAEPVADIETEFWSEYPAAIRQVFTQKIDGRPVTRTQACAGGTGWIKEDAQTIRALAEDEVRYWRNLMVMGWANEVHPLADDPTVGLVVVGRQPIAGRPAVGVAVTRLGRPDSTLWFDVETHLLVRRDARTADGRVREAHYSDYTEQDGVRKPTREVFFIDGQKAAEIVTSEHRHTERLDPALLARPRE